MLVTDVGDSVLMTSSRCDNFKDLPTSKIPIFISKEELSLNKLRLLDSRMTLNKENLSISPSSYVNFVLPLLQLFLVMTLIGVFELTLVQQMQLIESNYVNRYLIDYYAAKEKTKVMFLYKNKYLFISNKNKLVVK